MDGDSAISVLIEPYGVEDRLTCPFDKPQQLLAPRLEALYFVQLFLILAAAVLNRKTEIVTNLCLSLADNFFLRDTAGRLKTIGRMVHGNVILDVGL